MLLNIAAQFCNQLLPFNGEQLRERIRCNSLRERCADDDRDDAEQQLRVRRVGVENIVYQIFADGRQCKPGNGAQAGEQ